MFDGRIPNISGVHVYSAGGAEGGGDAGPGQPGFSTKSAEGIRSQRESRGIGDEGPSWQK